MPQARGAAVVEAAQLDFAQYVRPGDLVAWGQAGAEPCMLSARLMAQRGSIGGRFRVFAGITWSDSLAPEYADTVDFVSYCGSGPNGRLAGAGLLDILPVHYAQLDQALTRGPNRVDVLLLQVAPPDAAGRYSLSIAHEYLLPLVERARVVIAEVNVQAPWTYGERTFEARDFDVLVPSDRAPLEAPAGKGDDVTRAIAHHAAALIEDGATLQLGIGALPEAIVANLYDRRDLGVHSGTIGDAVAALIEAGAVTNRRKTRDAGVTVAGIMMGSRRVYAHAHRNPAVQFRPPAYTHDIDVLGSIDRLVAINSALEVDLTGQINAEAVGGRYVGAVGGAVDFMRGAARSRGGLPIIALPARSRHGSRIVARLLSGPVSTPRSDAGVVITEFGVADLRGLTLAQRVRRMLDIAAPESREALAAQYHAVQGAASG
ncbi:MAG: acetyl-CoA hydrolase [Burkholderiaceae bacterium]|jgi:acetyl-CoA hydrolase|nr:acetyl-CoA hydrolase [Burkholderiaceae bacterium]